jgi:methanogenic corrinoid protein MtbC1
VLFLPENEIHDLGLLFLHYEIVSKGNHVIYLGRSLPIEDVAELNNHFKSVTFVTYLTVTPEEDNIIDYLKEFKAKALTNEKNELLVFGRRTEYLVNFSDAKIKVYPGIAHFLNEI